MGKQQKIQTITDLQNAVAELLKENGNVILKKSDNAKTVEEKIFRFPNQSPLVWGDFGIKKALFVEKFGEEVIEKFNLKEENGIIIVPTH